MAQRMIDMLKLKKSVSTQTGESAEFFVALSDTKHVALKYSSSYKDIVLSFNINSTKSFIISKPMWQIFRNYLTIIDHELGK